MYKLLPILLFGILVAEENSEPQIIQPDSLDFIWAQDKVDEWRGQFIGDISNIFDKDKLVINIENKIIDVVIDEEMDFDSFKKAQEKFILESDNNYFYSFNKAIREFLSESDNNYIHIHMPDSIDSRPLTQILYTMFIEVNIDKSIELDFRLKSTIYGILESNPLGDRLSKESIIFNSVDINQFQSKKNNTISLNRDDIYEDSWAVIIGIDKYKYSDQLNYAVKDAEAVKEMLINKFDYPEDNIRYLTDEEATLSNIKLNLGEVATSAGEDDRILVFYSGHGETLKGADGSEKGYIIPYEGRQDNPFGTGFAMDEILTTSQMSKSKHMLFLMDACYSGLMTEKAKGLSQPQEEGYLSKVANEKARQIITAGGRDEQVIERDEWQHSAFTKNLLAGLDDWEADTDDDGYITADELGTYLRKSVTEDSDFQQTPQKGRFRNSGGGEFVFFGSGNRLAKDLIEITNESDSLPIMLFDIGVGHKKIINDERYYSRKMSFIFPNMFENMEILFAHERGSTFNESIDLRHNGFMIELRVYRTHLLKFDFSNSSKFLFYSFGVSIEDISYSNNEFGIHYKNVGIMPEVGIGFDFNGIVMPVKIGYAINDIKDNQNRYIYNGLMLKVGLEWKIMEFTKPKQFN